MGTLNNLKALEHLYSFQNSHQLQIVNLVRLNLTLPGGPSREVTIIYVTHLISVRPSFFVNKGNKLLYYIKLSMT